MIPTNSYITIGKLARRAGTTVQTIRYYEIQELLIPAHRTQTGYRLYDENSITTFFFIKNAQAIGFSLKQISLLLKIRKSKRNQSTRLLGQIKNLSADFSSQIDILEDRVERLSQLAKACRKGKKQEKCTAIEVLEKSRK